MDALFGSSEMQFFETRPPHRLLLELSFLTGTIRSPLHLLHHPTSLISIHDGLYRQHIPSPHCYKYSSLEGTCNSMEMESPRLTTKSELSPTELISESFPAFDHRGNIVEPFDNEARRDNEFKDSEMHSSFAVH